MGRFLCRSVRVKNRNVTTAIKTEPKTQEQVEKVRNYDFNLNASLPGSSIIASGIDSNLILLVAIRLKADVIKFGYNIFFF